MLQTADKGDIQRHVLLLFALGVLQEEDKAGDRHVFLVCCSRRAADLEVIKSFGQRRVCPASDRDVKRDVLSSRVF